MNMDSKWETDTVINLCGQKKKKKNKNTSESFAETYQDFVFLVLIQIPTHPENVYVKTSIKIRRCR